MDNGARGCYCESYYKENPGGSQAATSKGNEDAEGQDQTAHRYNKEYRFLHKAISMSRYGPRQTRV